MNTILEHFNLAASAFVKVALPMLAQSSVLIAALLLVDLLVRRRVRAVSRYWMWMLVVIQLLSPPVLLLRGAAGNLSGGKAGFVGAAQIASVIDVGVTSQPKDSSQHLETGTLEGISSVPAQTSPTITWEGAIFLVWLIVVAIMGLLLLRQVFAVGKLVSCAKQANWIMNDSLEYCCKCVGVKRKVRLKLSANGAGPAVCGLFWPVILVPQNLARNFGSRYLRVVLLHELGHIKRGDLWVNLTQTVLQVVYFYNPLLWVANSIIRKVREQAVNETVLAAVGEHTRWYPDTLGAIAKLAFKPPALSVGLIEKIENRPVSSESARTPLAN
jgi:beta-lactamase regulating signal transducer with metallopeptidase domain